MPTTKGRIPLDQVDVNINAPVSVVFDLEKLKHTISSFPICTLTGRRNSGNIYSLIAPNSRRQICPGSGGSLGMQGRKIERCDLPVPDLPDSDGGSQCCPEKSGPGSRLRCIRLFYSVGRHGSSNECESVVRRCGASGRQSRQPPHHLSPLLRAGPSTDGETEKLVRRLANTGCPLKGRSM